MRFFGTFLGLLGAIVMTTALGVFTTPEVDNTTSGLSRLQVPPPQTPARFRQATRAGLVARQARGPARRQNSAAPICNRPSTGTTPYAIFTDAFFATNHGLGEYAATLEKCYADCEARPACVAVTYVTLPSSSASACRPISEIVAMGTSGGTGQSLYGGIQGEAKGMTCAQVKALFTYAATWNCCDTRR